MSTKAVLLCRPNSHPFQERTLFLDQPVKVGRSVARVRPGPNNGVFDCKVLSRNHALLWYDNGKFYLQDTKSSNGTFVNNQRLSKGSEESLPREVCSGDIVQFGVDVMENSRKVTHGCIIATIKLYLPDGKEAKASPSTAMVSTQELYQLAQYLQEALHREQMLENKLLTLQKLVTTTETESESSWKALIDEDRLLTRLEILENQVQSCSKNIGEDRLREEVLLLQEDKDQYQVAAKELLKTLLQEKLEAVKKLQDAERSLGNAENECKNLVETYEMVQKELHDLAASYNARLKEIQELTEKLQEVESKEKEKMEFESEKKSIESTIESLQDVENYGKDPLTIITESMKPDDTLIEIENAIIKSAAVQVDLIENGHGQLNEELRDKLRDSQKELLESHVRVADLNKLLDRAQVEAVKSMNKVAQLEVQLQEAKTLLENSSFRIKHLQDKIKELETKLQRLQEEPAKVDPKLTIIYESEVEDPTPTITLPLPPRSTSPTTTATVTVNGNVEDHPSLPDDRVDEDTTTLTVTTEVEEPCHRAALKAEIDKLKELLSETRESKFHAEKEVARFKVELEDARNNVKKAADDSNILRQQLQQAQIQGKERSEVVLRLQDQLTCAESCSRDAQQQLTALRERLSQEQQLLHAKQGDIDILRQQLVEAQHNYKQAHNEAEQLRNKLEAYAESHADTSSNERSSDDASASELQIVKDECFTLRGTILNLETKLRQTVNEKSKLLEEISQVSLKQSILSTSISAPSGGADELLHMKVEESEQKLLVAYSEIVNLKEKCAAYNEEKSRLRQQLDTAGHNDFQMWRILVPILVAALMLFYLY